MKYPNYIIVTHRNGKYKVYTAERYRLLRGLKKRRHNLRRCPNGDPVLRSCNHQRTPRQSSASSVPIRGIGVCADIGSSVERDGR